MVRNRLRRRLRAIVAVSGLRPGAYLIGAAPEAASLQFGELKVIVQHALAATAAPRR